MPSASRRSVLIGMAFSAPFTCRVSINTASRPASVSFGSRTVTQRDLLTGSSFVMTGGTQESGSYALWGRGAVTRFDGRDGGLTLDGEVACGMLGADWTRGAMMAGLVVSHSLGEGSYRGEDGNGGVSSSLTGFYPWGRYSVRRGGARSRTTRSRQSMRSGSS